MRKLKEYIQKWMILAQTKWILIEKEHKQVIVLTCALAGFICVKVGVGCFEPVWHEEPEIPESIRKNLETKKCWCVSDFIASRLNKFD